MSADDLTETLAAIKSRNDFGEAYQDDVDALLSAVEGVLALCNEHSRIEKHNESVPLNWISDVIAEPTAEQYRKALTDALGADRESSNYSGSEQ